VRAAALVCLMASGPAHAADKADLVLRGGRVFVAKGRTATAIAVRGVRVAAVGDDGAVAGLVGPATRVVELQGRLVVPGFNDAHVHFLSGGFGLLSVDLREAKDEADLARRIGEHARTLPKGTWIQEGNWDHESWPSKALPTRQMIDPVTPDHPVFVNRFDRSMFLAKEVRPSLSNENRIPPQALRARSVSGAEKQESGPE